MNDQLEDLFGPSRPAAEARDEWVRRAGQYIMEGERLKLELAQSEQHIASLRVVRDEADARAFALYHALYLLTIRCDGPLGVRSDGSNIDTSEANSVLEKYR